MNPFWRKGADRASSPDGISSANNHFDAPPHRLTLALARIEKLATMLARSRASDAIDVADVLGAMYLDDWDSLSHYWQESDQDGAQEFLRGICNLSPQRWHAWIETYERLRNDWQRKRSWNPLRKSAKDGATDKPLRRSEALAAVLKHAEDIAPFADVVGDCRVPILTTECVFLCIAKATESEIARGLAATRLDLSELEREVFFPKRAPLV